VRLACSECGAEAASGSLFCSGCQGLLEFRLDPAGLDVRALRLTFKERHTSNDALDQSGVWRFRELLPEIALERVVTLRENAVPVYRAQVGAAYADATNLTYLHLGMNPTASFKDAGMTVAISHARSHGARVAVCASTGNTAASMAAYAARAGMSAFVLVPAGGVSAAKMAQTLDYGATVVAIEGDFDRALEIVRRLDPQRVAIVNSVNPYRIEGQKCAAFVLLESRYWKAPDWIVMPGGNLGNSSAFGKGFREARDLRLSDRIPKIAVIQAAGAAPFANVFRDGGDLVPLKAETDATAIRIGAPASWRKALAEVRAGGGTVTTVSDEEIAEARAVIGRDGIGCEPASAASLAGLRKLRQAGTIARDEDVVLVLTGHVLKDSAYAATFHASRNHLANKIVNVSDETALRALIDKAIAVHA
jgi:threonine synthase